MPEKLKKAQLAARAAVAAEPVAVAALIRAVILCAVAFGLQWTVDQIAAVMVVVELAAAIITRSRVTPS